MKRFAPLTANDLLQVGYWFQREERQFEITAWNAKDPLQVEARAADTGMIHVFTLTDLFAPRTSASAIVVPSRSFRGVMLTSPKSDEI